MTDNWRNWFEPAEAAELARIEQYIHEIDTDMAKSAPVTSSTA